MSKKFGAGKQPTGTPSLGWSCVVAIVSLLSGASVVHNIYKPNLTLPPVEGADAAAKEKGTEKKVDLLLYTMMIGLVNIPEKILGVHKEERKKHFGKFTLRQKEGILQYDEDWRRMDDLLPANFHWVFKYLLAGWFPRGFGLFPRTKASRLSP
uniref:Uncharacterized protein n=1 Tax=Salix viminalis TaxID=40686 RepID=A0A6N2NGS4_SALVM